MRFGTWVLVRLQDVYGRFGAWVLVLGAVWSLMAGAPVGRRKVPLSKMLMGLWSRKQKFRFQISKSKYVAASFYTGFGPA